MAILLYLSMYVYKLEYQLLPSNQQLSKMYLVLHDNKSVTCFRCKTKIELMSGSGPQAELEFWFEQSN